MRVLEGSHEFFKFKLCNYNILEISLKKNILEIKNILILNINLSFFKKLLLKNMKDFTIFFYISNLPNSFLLLHSKLPNKAYEYTCG